ncbi:MAG: glycerol-3-phosphate acyltransferase [Actinomycetota bacterium]
MIWSLAIGYVVGSIPSADAVGRARGIDLRAEGTGNPGAANALRVGGPRIALMVLLLDVAKGAAAAIAGRFLAGDAGGVAGAVAAIYGQVANPWHRFKGGKGLGVTGGAAIVLWPPGVALVLPIIAAAAKAFGSALGGLVGITSLLGLSVLWAANGWPTAWGVHPDDTLVWFTIWVLVLTAPKFVTTLLERFRTRRSSPRR